MRGGLSLVVKGTIVLAWHQGIPTTDERLQLALQYQIPADAHLRVDNLGKQEKGRRGSGRPPGGRLPRVFLTKVSWSAELAHSHLLD